MNHIYRLVWNAQTQRYQPAPETARGHGKSTLGQALRPAALVLGAAFSLPACIQAAPSLATNALPTGAQVVAGQAAVSQSGSQMTVNQGSGKTIIDWNSFNIGSGAAVQFIQPSSSAVALNRVVAGDASQIHGRLSANGQVWLVNPQGVLFGQSSKVDVGGLVASALHISNADFLAGKAVFNRNGATGSVINQGELKAADGGLVALLAPTVRNEGIVRAQLGSVAMAAGDKITLQAGANGLLQVAVDPATVRTLVENQQLIVADGGQVVMTGKAANALSASVVSNSGTIQARTLAHKEGRILLLADMEHGEARVAGRLDASAPSDSTGGNGGNGGFIETSAAKVALGAGHTVTTLAAGGKTGTWLIDPNDFTIGLDSGDITGRQLSANLAHSNVTIQSASGSQVGNGDIFVNAPVTWSANTTLTLQAYGSIKVNADISASGNQAGLALSTQLGNIQLDHGARINLNGSSPLLRMGFLGHENTYTVINSLEALQNIGMTGYYALGSNLTAPAGSNTNFSPIGNESAKFQGTFDGLGHEISNLRIDGGSRYSVGLFGATQAATIRNLGLVDSTVKGHTFNSGGFMGDQQGTGAIVGWADGGGIFNVYALNTQVESESASVGGLVGYLQGANLYNSFVTGNVTLNDVSGKGTLQQIGGLVGLMSPGSTISNSYTTANVHDKTPQATVGSLVGYAMGYGSTIHNSFAANALLLGNSPAGGLIGGYEATGSIFAYASYYTNWGWISDGVGTQLTGPVTSSAMGNLNTTSWNLDIASALPVLRAFQRDAFVVANDLRTTYGSSAGTPSYTVSGASVAGGNLSGYQSAINAGSYAITPSGFYLASADRQRTGSIFYGAGTLTIDKAPLTVTANSSSKTYDGLAWNGTPGVSYSGFVNGENSAQLGGALQYGGSANGAQNAGSYLITPTGLSSSNYAISYVDGSLSILPRAITVQVGDQTRAYGNANASSGSLSLFSGTLAGSDALGSANVSSLATASSNAGQSYALNASSAQFTAGNPSNYDISYRSGTLTITPRAISLQPQDMTRVYGASNPGSGAWAVVAGSLANGDSLGLATLTSDAHVASSAGQSYALSSSNAQFAAGNASNYQITYQNGSLTITKAPLTITAHNGGKTYDGLAWSGGNGVSYSGFVNGEGAGTLSGSLVYGGNAQGARNAGIYALTPGGLGSDNYAITFVDGSLSIAKAPLAITANSVSKTYDGLVWSGGNGVSYSGFVHGEDIGALSGSLVYGGNALGARNAGSYTLMPGGLGSGNYAITFVDGHLTVTPAALTITTGAVTKTYDGSTAANGTAIATGGTQLFGSDTLSGGSFAFNDKNAGTGKTVAVSAVTINDGNGGNNYAVTYADNSASTIHQAALTVTTGAVTKTYDGSTAANGTAIATGGTQLFGPDTLSGGSFVFNDKNAGSGKIVAVSGVTIQDGNGGNNYAVTYADNSASTIHKAGLTITTGAVAKTYDGTTTANGTAMVGSGQLFGADLLSGGSFAFNDKNAGSGKSVAVSGVTIQDGNGGHNYAITYADNTASTIHKANATVTANSASLTYNGQTQHIDGFTAEGLVNGEAVGVLAGVTEVGGSGRNVGSYLHTLAGTDTNYELRFVDGRLNVLPAHLSITTSAVSKTYDGSTAANGFTIVNGGSQLFGSDTLSGGSFAFADKNAGTGKTVTVSGVTVQDGNGGNNYAVTYADNTTSAIHQAALTVTTGAATKTYDGSTATHGTASVSNGQLFGADTLFGGTFSFDNKNVGTGKTVSVSDVTIQDGNGGRNYAVTYADNPIGTIHKATLTAKANSIHQTYDGQAFAGGNGLTFSGFAPGDDANMLSGSLHYSGNAQGARNAGSYTLAATGLDSANYDVHFVDGLLTISPAALHITSSAVQKTYDGSTSANGTALVYSGQLFDTDRLSGGSFAFRDRNAGDGKAVSVSGVTVEDGNGGRNYTISYVDNCHSVIERAPLHIAVQDAHMIAGGHAPAGSAFVVAEGQLQNGETVQQIRLHSPGLATGATAGRYVLEASDAQGDHGFHAANYDIRYAPAWLTVTAPTPTASLPDGGLLGSRTQPDLPLQQQAASWTPAFTTGNATFLSLAPDFIRIEGEP